MNTVILVTEANDRVATGHLMECIVCADELLSAGYNISFWINRDAPVGLKERIPCGFQEYCGSVEEDDLGVIAELTTLNPCAIVFNLRKISNMFVLKVRGSASKNTKIICVDEFGNRDLQADIIVNPMVDPYYWNYGTSGAKLYSGAQYLMLEKELDVLHKKEKKIAEEILSIVISMGGVDPKGYTLDLLSLVPGYFPDTVIKVVIGAGNPKSETIMNAKSAIAQVEIFKNISNLSKMMYEADLVFCAGGNTLYEAACVGTPAIVLPSMPHENRTAMVFERSDFCRVIRTEQALKTELSEIVKEISPHHKREQMSQNGKRIVDGLGRLRMVNIISNLGD